MHGDNLSFFLLLLGGLVVGVGKQICNVREYGKEATFEDPSRSLILSDVFCTSCNECQDVDLCKESQAHICSCGERYDMELMESRLIEVVQDMAVFFLFWIRGERRSKGGHSFFRIDSQLA